jgi:hypothetical protein
VIQDVTTIRVARVRVKVFKFVWDIIIRVIRILMVIIYLCSSQLTPLVRRCCVCINVFLNSHHWLGAAVSVLM